jgi:hypothetical protein
MSCSEACLLTALDDRSPTAVYIALRTPILPGAKGAFSERLLPDAVTESDAAATKPNGKAKSAAVEKKQQHTQLDTLRILVLGDSLAEGVGLLTNDLSVCGRMVHALQAQLNPSNSDVKPIIIEQVTIAKVRGTADRTTRRWDVSYRNAANFLLSSLVLQSGYWADRMEKKLLKRIPANFIDPQMRLKASESHVAPAEFELKPETDVAFGGRVQTIVILSNGANSAVRMHSARAAAKELKSLAKAIHEKLGPGSEEVPIFHLGMPPLHLFPALPPLISRIIGWRERSVARAIKQVSAEMTRDQCGHVVASRRRLTSAESPPRSRSPTNCSCLVLISISLSAPCLSL